MAVCWICNKRSTPLAPELYCEYCGEMSANAEELLENIVYGASPNSIHPEIFTHRDINYRKYFRELKALTPEERVKRLEAGKEEQKKQDEWRDKFQIACLIFIVVTAILLIIKGLS